MEGKNEQIKQYKITANKHLKIIETRALDEVILKIKIYVS